MQDFILYKKLLKEVDDGNVSVSELGDLRLFKYTPDCHIEGRWNEWNRKARGIIFRTDGTVVARPFEKFFNLGEISEVKIENLPWHESIEITEKLDGSCGIGYIEHIPLECECCSDEVWKLATPGSFESDQAKIGTDILKQYNTNLLPHNCTPVFEIVYPENRIVVNYNGETFLALLAIFELNGEEWHPDRVDQIATSCGFRRPKRFDLDLRGDVPFEENAEGYVARFIESGTRVKVKSPAYTRIHRLLNYLSPKGVIDLIRGKEYGATLLDLPKIIQQDFDDIRGQVQTLYDQTINRAKDIYEKVPKEVSRKEQAAFIIANAPNNETGLVFGLLDQKDITDQTWRRVVNKIDA